MGRAKCLGQLGNIAYDRFIEARKAGRPVEECSNHLAQARQYYGQALEMSPASAVRDVATGHNQLGLVCANAGQIDASLHHFTESIYRCEAMQDHFLAGRVRENAARALAVAGRLVEACDWAQFALRDFEVCENAEQHVVKCLQLLEQIESARQASPPPS